MPSIESAIEYVNKVETRWYGAPYRVLSVTNSREVLGAALDIQTEENFWTVWVQENGELYGEC